MVAFVDAMPSLESPMVNPAPGPRRTLSLCGCLSWSGCVGVVEEVAARNLQAVGIHRPCRWRIPRIMRQSRLIKAGTMLLPHLGSDIDRYCRSLNVWFR